MKKAKEEEVDKSGCDLRSLEELVDPEEGVERKPRQVRKAGHESLESLKRRGWCVSKGGFTRLGHAYDKDGLCLYCPKKRGRA